MDGSAGRCTDDCDVGFIDLAGRRFIPRKSVFRPERAKPASKGAGFAGARCRGGEVLVVASIENHAREQGVFDPKRFSKD